MSSSAVSAASARAVRRPLAHVTASSSRQWTRHPASFSCHDSSSICARSDVQRYSSIRTFFHTVARDAQTDMTRRPMVDSRLTAHQKTLTAGNQCLSLRLAFSTSTTNKRNDDPSKGSSPGVDDPPDTRQTTTSDRNESKDIHDQLKSDTDQPAPDHADPSKAFANYPRSLRELALATLSRKSPSSTSTASSAAKSSSQSSSAPSSFRRPTKEDLLRSARGFWTRVRIRFKWFTIRGFRRFNADDFSAFFTLGGLGTIILIVIGTTTAVSVVLWALDMLKMQHWIARKIADYLTSQTGVTVVFESAIVPKWKQSRICFQNVFITRRAQANDPESLRLERDRKRRARVAKEQRESRRVRRGTASTAGQGMAWEGITWEETTDEDEVAPPLHPSKTGEELSDVEREGLNTNFTMFDLNVDSIDVTLSISRWFEGKGLIEDAVLSGVRGIIDRRNVVWDPNKVYDPKAARRTARPGDFELESFAVSDVLVTVYQPGNFRPFNFSIFNASIPKLRKQWLFYDLLSAESITGQVDGCLFSLHKPQSMGRTHEKEKELSASTGRWRTISRLRVDGVNIDHIQSQSGAMSSGPLSWILSGRFDVVADIRFPRDSADDVDINTIIEEIVDNLAKAVTGGRPGDGAGHRHQQRQLQRRQRGLDALSSQGDLDEDEEFVYEGEESVRIPGQHKLNEPAIEAPLTTVGPAAERAWRESIRSTGLADPYDEEAEGRNERKERGKRWRRRLKAALFSSSPEDPPLMDDASDEDDDDDKIDVRSSIKAKQRRLRAAASDPEAAEEAGESIPASDILPIPPPPSVVIDLDVRFKDVKAAVPLLHSSLTYSRQAFVRPIVAFMNANRTLIPVHAQVVMDLSEFDGSMDLAQTGLLPLISERLYDALASHVENSGANRGRLKRVSVWSLKSVLHVVLGLARQLRDGVGTSAVPPTAGSVGEVIGAS